MKLFMLGLAIIFCCNLHAQTSGITFKNSTLIKNSSSDTTKIVRNGKLKSVFITPEIILYNYKTGEITDLEIELEDLKTRTYNDSKELKKNQIFDSDQVKKNISRINEIEDEISLIRKNQDSLYKLYASDYLQYNNDNILNFGQYRSTALYDLVYNEDDKRFSFFNQTGLSFGDRTASIYSEIVSGNLGVFRVGLGTMISNSSEDNDEEAKEMEAYQRLATYGGNTVLSFEYPLAYLHSDNQKFNLLSRFTTKVAGDFPAFGTTTEDFAGHVSPGIDFYGDASLSNDLLRFYFNFNYNWVYGNDLFKENLGVDDKSFTFSQLTVGLVVENKFKLSLILGTFSSENSLKNRNAILGGQLLH